MPLVGFNLTIEFDCNAYYQIAIFFAYYAHGCIALLIVLRAIAIWERRAIVIALVIPIWLLDISWLTIGIMKIHASWDPSIAMCRFRDTGAQRDTIIIAFATDVFLLGITLVGVLRKRSDSGLWRLLYHQGILGLVVATVAEVPITTFISLNLNDPMNMMFLPPHLIIMSISTTRMYSNLTTYRTSPVYTLPPLVPIHTFGLPTPHTGTSHTISFGRQSAIVVSKNKKPVAQNKDDGKIDPFMIFSFECRNSDPERGRKEGYDIEEA